MRKRYLLALVLVTIIVLTLCGCQKKESVVIDVKGTWVATYDYNGHHFKQVLEFAEDTYTLSIYQDDILGEDGIQHGTYAVNSAKVILVEEETKLFTKLKWNGVKLKNNSLVIFERAE